MTVIIPEKMNLSNNRNVYASHKTFNKFIFGLILLFLSQSAFAYFECNVKIMHVLVYSNGLLNVMHDGRKDFTVLCNLNADRQGVTPTTCAVWFALVESAKKRNGIVNFYYGGDGSCATLRTYDESPPPSYVGDMGY
ncbi:hypothetical protein [Massilia phyllosphaerae]|uniref:hypothetical protein n=1 Tax=Massilia phyllosphaerae TaxID=3106034 RepID=UPI002B1CD9DB|nr:hypothetical protein [Massilia sp. SGZ-792]